MVEHWPEEPGVGVSKAPEAAKTIRFIMNPSELMQRVKRMKGCPFCGARPFVGQHPSHPGKFVIRCSDDMCTFLPASVPFLREDFLDYINQWNNRAP